MRTKRMLFGALTVVLLAACSNDENGVIDTTASRATFTAAIGERPATRAYDQTWEKGDKIGISGKSGTADYFNIAYQTTAGNGNFTVVTPGEEIYYQDDNEVLFTAYYPWNKLDIGATTIEADTWNQANQNSFDFLWAQASGRKTVPNTSVAFEFAHKMSKVVLTVKKGADVSFDEVKAAVMSLEGFKHMGNFDITTGIAIAGGNASTMWQFANAETVTHNAPLTENKTAGTVAYTLIVFPQAFDVALPISAELTGSQTFKTALDFTEANKAANDTEPKNEWVAGRQYNLSVTLHKTALKVEGCTITEWEETDGGDFKAE